MQHLVPFLDTSYGWCTVSVEETLTFREKFGVEFCPPPEAIFAISAESKSLCTSRAIVVRGGTDFDPQVQISRPS